MGTHPIFESDFDCLTEKFVIIKMGEIATEEVPTVDVLRRNRPGSTRADWSNWPDQEFCNMESIHAAQMLIQQRIRNCRLSIDKILEKPEGADEDVWKYEHLRQFCQELNGLATRLQAECSPTTCPQLTSGSFYVPLTNHQRNALQLITPDIHLMALP